MEQNLSSALVCFLKDLSEFKKKHKPDAGLLNTLHDRARAFRLQYDRLVYGTKSVKVQTIEETTVVLQEAHISEAGSHIQRPQTSESVLGSLSMGIRAFLGGVSGFVQELVKELLFHYNAILLMLYNATYLSYTFNLIELRCLVPGDLS